MEVLAPALVGLAGAIAGLAGALWRLQRANRQNGHHASEELRLLGSIDKQLGSIGTAQTENQKQLVGTLSKVDSALAVLLDRRRSGPG